MNDEELACFLSYISYARDTPWSERFAVQCCKRCPQSEYILEHGQKLNLHECDFDDGKCPNGSEIVWWLQQPAEIDELITRRTQKDGGK